ncbi:FAD-binding oxidoreductase [Actinomycetospora atypica]|uniref:FAD-binding oxidoreductase n=1 Tax=Actinomycetospora atypica TaxID=1290095 RepID=A0ABV9YTS5_9PSEU
MTSTTHTHSSTTLLPGDPGWEAAVSGFDLSVEHRPDVVALPRDADEVAEVVRAARADGLRVAVVGTGHGAPPGGPGTVLLRTEALDEVVVDPVGRVARIGGGARWRDVVEACAPHGLAALGGSSSGVGVVGYLLGGGFGPMVRTFGAAADRVLAVELVDANGTSVRLDATHGADWFAALRGGGLAHGVITAVEIELVAVRTVTAGGLWFDAADAGAVLAAWQAWTRDLPDTLTTSIARVNLPPDPALPEVLRGRALVHVRVVHVGDALDDEARRVADPEAAQALLAPLRAAACPLLDSVGVLPVTALDAVHQDPTGPMPVTEAGMLLDRLAPETAEALLRVAAPQRGLPLALVEVRLLGGALDAPRGDVPFDAVRGRRSAAGIHAIAAPVPGLPPEVGTAAVDAVLEALAPWSGGGALPSFAGRGTASSARIATAMGPDLLARLAAVQATADPDDVFAPARRWDPAGSVR